MNRPRIGSLCTGAGMLDEGARLVIGGSVAWHSEIEPAACRVLDHRYPGVPNIGDLTTVEWESVEPVDGMCAGYPCQPFSHAGQRKGTDDERHLWPYVAEAVRRVRPGFVFLENVAGHRSLGLDSVLGDLAALGYDATWTCIRASDVGAPHGRERIFILATDTERGELQRWGGPGAVGGAPAAVGRNRRERQRDGDAARDSGRPLTADPANLGHERGGGARAGWAGSAYGSGDAAHTASDARRVEHRDDLPPADAERGGRDGWAPDPLGQPFGRTATAGTGANVRWGQYEPAIRQWERLTHPVPTPTRAGRKGPQLAPKFSEWLMGWPAGWVTDVPGLSRNEQLRIIGNGVVPQQAAAALTWLLDAQERAA